MITVVDNMADRQLIRQHIISTHEFDSSIKQDAKEQRMNFKGKKDSSILLILDFPRLGVVTNRVIHRV